jgi:pimeloyl-ACP methyl ester carboxylesterase
MAMNCRSYGGPLIEVVVVHGGPGAQGEMAPVAKELSKNHGILEPLQTEDTVAGQIEELRSSIERSCTRPVILIGWSWGAWLSLMLAAEHPSLVRRLFLVSSGPFSQEYAEEIMHRRLSRLMPKDRKRTEYLLKVIRENDSLKDNKILEEFGTIMSKADSYSPLPGTSPEEDMTVDMNIYNKVWIEAEELRKSGKLLDYGKKIKCPVVVIHGDHDPHPYEGVREPLSRVLAGCEFILLPKCGHHPWQERFAKDKFYDILRKGCSGQD